MMNYIQSPLGVALISIALTAVFSIIFDLFKKKQDSKVQKEITNRDRFFLLNNQVTDYLNQLGSRIYNFENKFKKYYKEIISQDIIENEIDLVDDNFQKQIEPLILISDEIYNLGTNFDDDASKLLLMELRYNIVSITVFLNKRFAIDIMPRSLDDFVYIGSIPLDKVYKEMDELTQTCYTNIQIALEYFNSLKFIK